MREFKFSTAGGTDAELQIFFKMCNFCRDDLKGTSFEYDQQSKNVIDVYELMKLNSWRSVLVGKVRSATRDVRSELNPFDCDWSEILFFDTETQNEGKQWGMAPREFFRLGQYAWGDGDVVLTTDYDEMIEQIRRAKGVVAHNAHNFDLSTLFGKDSTEPLRMAKDRRVIDTLVLANLAFPAPDRFQTRSGSVVCTDGSPAQVLKWLGLDNLTFQMGLPGKFGNMKDMAKPYNPKGTKAKDLDLGLIPLTDKEFLEYARQDVIALRSVFERLISMHSFSEYDWREQLKAAINAQVTRNGFAVDKDKARARADYLAQRAETLKGRLEREYGLPTTGKQPWRSNAGKEAIMRALAEFGVTPETHPSWKKTKTGYSLGGEVLEALCEGVSEEAEQFAADLRELLGQRSLSRLTLDSLKEDGCVHPDISDMQRSGRSSTRNPGLTVWTARGAGAVEKSYLVAHPGCKLVSFDYSNADARIVAGYSQDPEYAKKFEPGADGHEMTGRLVWGDEEYDAAMPDGWETDDEIRHKNPYRQKAKALSHAWNYGGGAATISKASKQPLDVCEHFVQKMAEAYPRVVAWREDCYRQGERGFIYNAWGRRMPVTIDRAYTQASALMGQSGTREIITDALIRMLDEDERFVTWVVAQVHDELLFSIPEKELDWAVPRIAELMSTTWKGVDFFASHGTPADNWEEAGH